MHFPTAYPIVNLDTIANSATFFSGKWTPDLKLNQSRDLLRLVINKLYWPCRSNIFRGNPFHARVQASHASLADHLDLTREWTCKLVARLRDAKWIETYAPRKPNGKYQEVTIFRPGKKLKRLLVMLLKSNQRPHNHISVNSDLQQIPTSKIPQHEVEKNLLFLRDLQRELGEKLAMKT